MYTYSYTYTYYIHISIYVYICVCIWDIQRTGYLPSPNLASFCSGRHLGTGENRCLLRASADASDWALHTSPAILRATGDPQSLPMLFQY